MQGTLKMLNRGENKGKTRQEGGGKGGVRGNKARAGEKSTENHRGQKGVVRAKRGTGERLGLKKKKKKKKKKKGGGRGLCQAWIVGRASERIFTQ